MIQSIMAVVNSNHFHCVSPICLDNLHGKSPLTGQLSQLSSLFQVVRKWRSLAIRLGLSEYILDIDCWRGASGASGVSGVLGVSECQSVRSFSEGKNSPPSTARWGRWCRNVPDCRLGCWRATFSSKW